MGYHQSKIWHFCLLYDITYFVITLSFYYVTHFVILRSVIYHHLIIYQHFQLILFIYDLFSLFPDLLGFLMWQLWHFIMTNLFWNCVIVTFSYTVTFIIYSSCALYCVVMFCISFIWPLSFCFIWGSLYLILTIIWLYYNGSILSYLPCYLILITYNILNDYPFCCHILHLITISLLFIRMFT